MTVHSSRVLPLYKSLGLRLLVAPIAARLRCCYGTSIKMRLFNKHHHKTPTLSHARTICAHAYRALMQYYNTNTIIYERHAPCAHAHTHTRKHTHTHASQFASHTPEPDAGDHSIRRPAPVERRTRTHTAIRLFECRCVELLADSAEALLLLLLGRGGRVAGSSVAFDLEFTRVDIVVSPAWNLILHSRQPMHRSSD